MRVLMRLFSDVQGHAALSRTVFGLGLCTLGWHRLCPRQDMDTFEARHQMRELARRGLALVEGFVRDGSPTPESSSALRAIAADARALVPDAGFPAEAAWRALAHAANALVAMEPDPEGLGWLEIVDELRVAVDGLDSLLGSARREADFRIVG